MGLRLWQLGTLAPLTEPLRSLAQPFIEDLYTALHQHVQLAVLEGQEAVIIERLSAPEAVELISQVGGRLPLHCSAVGKVLLSHSEPELIETVLSRSATADPVRACASPAFAHTESRFRADLGCARNRNSLCLNAGLAVFERGTREV